LQLIILKKTTETGKRTASVNDGPIQIGIVIAKKTGKAHYRNVIKRRMRAICRDYLPKLDSSYCLILRPGKDFHLMDYAEQKKIMDSLFRKTGLLVE
jgi:ribonuclease P protein component